VNKERVLVTGAKGFLGRALCPFLIEQGFEVIELHRGVCDLKNSDAVKAFVQSHAPHFVVHLAARVTPGPGFQSFQSQFEDSVIPAINLALAVPADTKLCIMTGSIEEYGRNKSPFTEDMEPDLHSTYGWGKVAAFDAVKMIFKQNQIPFSWVRPSLMIGPQAPSQLFFAQVLKACLLDQDLDLTACEQLRDFIYVKDVCEHYLRILRAPDLAKDGILNLSSGRGQNLKDLALQIQRITGKGKLHFGKLPYRSNEVMSFYSSNKNFNERFGEVPLTSLNQALSEIIEAESKTLA
jgi:nucleoside-diphosphate-sugar epimerase